MERRKLKGESFTMKNEILDQIKDNITHYSEYFNEERTTCLEYGGLDEELLTFEHEGRELSIQVDSQCFYSINGRHYLDSMVAEEDLTEYRQGNYSCWYMNSFFIKVDDETFTFHDMNEDAEGFLNFLNNITNKNN